MHNHAITLLHFDSGTLSLSVYKLSVNCIFWPIRTLNRLGAKWPFIPGFGNLAFLRPNNSILAFFFLFGLEKMFGLLALLSSDKIYVKTANAVDTFV